MNSSNNNNKNVCIKKSVDKFENLKANFFLQKTFDLLEMNKYLKIIKYNKKIQERLNLSIKNYKDYGQIKIEIIPIKNAIGEFIHIVLDSDKKYFHIYFNDNYKKEIKRYSLKKNDKVNKITVIIDAQITTFYKLFEKCKCIKSISFKQFYRKNIRNMESLFYECTSLKEIDFSNFHTNNVISMRSMFYKCPLEKIDLSNFKTDNVMNMCLMFCECKSLKKLDLSNFNTNKVETMKFMFSDLKMIKELDISNFDTSNLENVSFMFCDCTSLKKIIFNNNFNINNYIANNTFRGCSTELQNKVKEQFKNINQNAFYSPNYF